MLGITVDKSGYWQITKLEINTSDNIMSMKVLAVIKEELNVSVGIDANPMVTIHQEDLHFAVWLEAVVGKPYFASNPPKCK